MLMRTKEHMHIRTHSYNVSRSDRPKRRKNKKETKKKKKKKDQQPSNRWRKLKILWIYNTFAYTPSIWIFVCAALMLTLLLLYSSSSSFFTTFIKCFQFANFWALLMRKPNLYISFLLCFSALMSPSAFSLLKNKEPKSLTPSVKNWFLKGSERWMN